MFDAAYQRGLVLYRQNRYHMAADEFLRALSLQPSHASAQSMFALCQMMLNNYSGAETAGRAALESNPNNAFSHYAMSHVLKRKASRQHSARGYPSAQRSTQVMRELMEPARFHAMESLRFDPANPEYLLLQAEIDANCDRLESALRALEIGLSRDPTHIGCANLRAFVLRRQGRLKEAKDTGDRALQIDPERSDTHLSHGMTLLQSQAPTAAIEHFKEALRLDPSDEKARTNLIAAARARYRLHNWFATRKGFPIPFLLGATILYVTIMMCFGLVADSGEDAASKYQAALVFAAGYLVTFVLSPQMLTFLLRFDPVVANALSDKQRIGSNIICTGAALVFIVGLGVALGGERTGLPMFLALSASLPFALGLAQLSWEMRRKWMRGAMVMAIVGIVAAMIDIFWFGEMVRNVTLWIAALFGLVDIIILARFAA